MYHFPSADKQYDCSNIIRQRKPEQALKSMKRGLHRIHTGASVKGSYLLVTLTAPGSVDLHTAWRKFRWRMRSRKLDYEYFAVKEAGEKTGHLHLHVLFRVDWMSVDVVRRQWTEACGSPVENCWTHHDKVTSLHDLGKYLTKYMLKNARIGLGRAYWYSAGWVFRKWVAFSKAMWTVGHGLSREKLLRQREQSGLSTLIACLLRAVTSASTGGFYLGRVTKTTKRLFRGFGISIGGAEWVGI